MQLPSKEPAAFHDKLSLLSGILGALVAASSLSEKVPAILRSVLGIACLSALALWIFTAKSRSGLLADARLPRFSSGLRWAAAAFLLSFAIYTLAVWVPSLISYMSAPCIREVRPKVLVPGDQVAVVGDRLCSSCSAGEFEILLGRTAVTEILSARPKNISFTVPDNAWGGPLVISRPNWFPLARQLRSAFPVEVSALEDTDVVVRLESVSADRLATLRFAIFNRSPVHSVSVTDIHLVLLRAEKSALGTFHADRLNLGTFEIHSDKLSTAQLLTPMLSIQDRVVQIDPKSSEFIRVQLKPSTLPHSATLLFGVAATVYSDDGLLKTVFADRNLRIVSNHLQGIQAELSTPARGVSP